MSSPDPPAWLKSSSHHRTRNSEQKMKAEYTAALQVERSGRGQRVVAVTDPFGNRYQLAGPKGQERRVRCVYKDGSVRYFEGTRGEEVPTRQEYPDGRVVLYRRVVSPPHGGPRKYVKKRTICPGGLVAYYQGDELFREKKWREDYPDGEVRNYQGENGSERLVRVEDKDGVVTRYEGEKGHERRVCMTDAFIATVYHYEGPKGHERMVRQVDVLTGRVWHYSGTRGRERLSRVTFPDGSTCRYVGERGHERRSVMEFSSGQVNYYGGEGSFLVQMRRADGRIIHRAGCRWISLMKWVKARAIVLYWLERTQERLCAPGGEGRRADCEAFEREFRAA